MEEHFEKVLRSFPAYVPLTVAPDVWKAATTAPTSVSSIRRMGIPRHRVGRHKVLKTSDIVERARKTLGAAK